MVQPAPIQPVILASASPRRRELLGQLGVSFRVVSPSVDEWEDPAADPVALVRHNARIKAAAVPREPGQVLIAADTTVALDDTVLNKPADLTEARSMLRRLSGRTHRVLTALVVAGPAPNDSRERVVETRVTFRNLDDALITHYFTLVNPLDKAGAYGAQTGRELILAGWSGPFSNIVGLPLAATAELLTAAGLTVGPVPAEPDEITV